MSKCFNRSGWTLAAAFVLIIVILAGCGGLVDQVVSTRASTVALVAGRSIGQTFVAQHGGLNGVEFWLTNDSDSEVRIDAHLRRDPTSSVNIAATSLVIPATSETLPYRFAFPPVNDSHNQYLYVGLELDGSGEVQVNAGPGSTYLNGSLYEDGEPLDAQADFRLVYDPVQAAYEGMRSLGWLLGLLAAMLLIWLLPGWALLELILGHKRWSELGWAERAGLAAGSSVALYSLLMLWTNAIGIRPRMVLVWGPCALSFALLLWRHRKWRPGRIDWRHKLREGMRQENTWSSLLLVAALVAIFVVRLLVVRTLDAPSWGDSVQHAVMTQLMVDQGGLFDTWAPYAPYKTLSVQFGFASNAAILGQVLNVRGEQAALLAGQLLNVLAVLGVYPLAVRLANGNRWAGLIAVIVAGLLSPMPAFYLNWGRYAQLTGQVILPVALWLLWEGASSRQFSLPTLAWAGAVLAGMMLSYYRMPYYYAAFALVWLCFWAAPCWRMNWREWAQGLGRLAAIAAGALVLVLPWMGHVAGSTLATGVENAMTRTTPVAAVLTEYESWRQVTDYAPVALLVAAAFALLWGVWRRNWAVFMIGPWMLLMASLVAGRLVGLPGANLLQSFAVMILLYIPLALLIGCVSGAAAARLLTRFGRAGLIITVAVLVLLMGFGLRSQLGIFGANYVLVTRPDARAMKWIRENSPENAVFLAEGYRVYTGLSAVGSDAGWWIPLLAERRNTMPPQYALMNEVPEDPDYSRSVVNLIATLETNSPSSAEARRALCELGVTHVYIGQTQGRSGREADQLLTPADLLADPMFAPIYHKDRVYIFALAANAC